MAASRRNAVYFALTGDLVASRAMPPKERAELQKHVLAMLADLNKGLGKTLAAPLTLTAGDAIQGLFRTPAPLVSAIQELTDRLFGVEYFPYIVFGAGAGILTTDAVPPSPRQAPNPALLDGPAFHHARSALEEAQRKRVWANFRGFGAPADEVLDALFSLMGAVRSRWSAEQGATSYRVRRHTRQKDLAKERGVSGSVVSESLKAAHHRTLLAGEEAARNFLLSLEKSLDG